MNAHRKTNVHSISIDKGNVTIYLKGNRFDKGSRAVGVLTIQFPGNESTRRTRANAAGRFLSDMIWSRLSEYSCLDYSLAGRKRLARRVR